MGCRFPGDAASPEAYWRQLLEGIDAISEVPAERWSVDDYFDPDPSAPYGIRLPVTHDTCEIVPDRWANWLKWDPLSIVEEHGPGLKRLKALYIDCGDVDQYNLVYGARRMHKRLDAMGVPHVYEEFPDNHSSVDYRMDVSLPILAKALTA